MNVLKNNGAQEPFEIRKILNAVEKAFVSCNFELPLPKSLVEEIEGSFNEKNLITIDEIQDEVERILMSEGYYKVARSYISYRERHRETRKFINKRIGYIDRYSDSKTNAASASETDSNANVTTKNVANCEGEVYKTTNRIIQRQMMKDILNKLFPEVAKQYEIDLEHHIIYTHDEASTPVRKPYCMAASLFPLLTEGVGNIDKVTPTPPNDIQSFSGQITNLVFLLSSQCKGAVALAEYFVAMNYYAIMEFGKKWYEILDKPYTSEYSKQPRTIKDAILKGFKQFVWGINQPAGNRSYQSPFTNISYFDHIYFESMFKDFYYPDFTKPEWKAIDTLQRMFMKWFNELRLKQILTFPVETMAMVHDGNDIIDKEYKDLCAEMYAEGHSFFTYISDSPDSLASCCRLRNELAENTFSPTSGLTGVMTGSCNVITLNMNRIVQDWVKTTTDTVATGYSLTDRYIISEGRKVLNKASLRKYLENILERVYKYQIAYKTMLYDMEEKGMCAASNGNYIHFSKLYSTIGINGLNEAARFFGMEVSWNKDYVRFLQMILGTIKEENKKHSINDSKRPFLFNSEVVPAEGLGGKNYNWDKEDGYWVPDDENLYNSYFYDAHKEMDILDKFRLHGKCTSKYCDGGSAAHINMDAHLTKKQYLMLLNFAVKQGTNYFTFNVPNSRCNKCGHIVKAPIHVCPKCGSTDIDWATRIIGYLKFIKHFGEDRQIEESQRVYTDGRNQLKEN